MAASTKQPFPIEDFSGGITDNNFSGELKSGQTFENFVVQPDAKLFSRSGSVVDDVANSPIPIGNSRIGRLFNLARNDRLLVQASRSFYYRPGEDYTGAYAHLLGPSGNEALSAGTTTNYVSAAEWNKQLFVVSDAFANPVKIYKDQAGQYQVRNVGVPLLSADPVITAGALGTISYVYGFIYTYQYQVGTQSFIEQGPVRFVTVSSAAEVSSNPIKITQIPVLSNGATDNYDTANVKLQIYRTAANGTNLYQVTEITNGTTTFTDSLSDVTLQTNQQLYTNDGTLDYAPAPQAKYVHIVGQMGIYGYTNDSDGPHPYRVHQSVVGNPGFVPAITYVDLGDEVKGLGSVKGLPIAFCKKLVYRLDGTFQSSGAGGMTAVKIHNSAGAIAHESIVEAENYLFWAGNDGFYACDGYQVIKISDHLNQTYQRMLRASKDVTRIQGRFDDINRRVYWAVQTKAQSLDNDTIFCLDLRWGIKPNSTFTTWSGQSFKPTAIEVFNGQLYRGDNNGFVFRHDIDVFTDPRVDISKNPTAWAQETIQWNYVSNQLNFGSSFFRKFVSRILVQAENAGNTSIQITAINDQGKKTRSLKPIRWRNNFTWGDEAFSWGNADCVWDAQGLIEQWRRFPAGGLRLSFLQLQIKNAFSIITTSSNDGQLSLNKINGTATLPNLWPSQSVDYVLYLSNDNFVRPFTVTAINGSRDLITLADSAGNLPPSGLYDWRLFGFEKGEPLNLIGYTLHWDNVDQNQATFHAGDSGAS